MIRKVLAIFLLLGFSLLVIIGEETLLQNLIELY